MTTATPSYATPASLTITLASLASDTNLLVGRESTARDNGGGDDAIDVLLGGKITTGTSPTAGRNIEVWVYATWNDGTNYSGGNAGTDGAKTHTAESKTLMKLGQIIATNNTSDTTYAFGPISLVALFGCMPERWGVWVVHNTGVNLNSTAGNHEISFTPLKYEAA